MYKFLSTELLVNEMIADETGTVLIALEKGDYHLYWPGIILN